MARTAFKLTGKWKQFRRALDPRVFEKTSRQHIRRATGINALLAVKTIRDVIGKGEVKPNAELSVAIKGSGKRPLVDTGDMRQAVTHKMIDDFTAFVGVLKTSGLYNIAYTVHERVVIPVTKKMRAMFYYLWLASLFMRGLRDKPIILTGRAAELWLEFEGPWRKLDKPAIINPSRPFIKIAFDDPVLHKHVRRNWEQAIMATLRELAR